VEVVPPPSRRQALKSVFDLGDGDRGRGERLAAKPYEPVVYGRVRRRLHQLVDDIGVEYDHERISPA
jgi:hypothetical protein